MKHAWKIINFILALVILGVTLGNYDSLSSFVVVALAAAVLVLVIDFLAVRRVSSTRVDYLLLVLPGLFLIGLFAAISATSALGTKLLVAVLALDVFYIHQSYFPKKPPAFIEETFTLTTSFLLLYGLWAINFFLTPAWWKTMDSLPRKSSVPSAVPDSAPKSSKPWSGPPKPCPGTNTGKYF